MDKVKEQLAMFDLSVVQGAGKQRFMPSIIKSWPSLYRALLPHPSRTASCRG